MALPKLSDLLDAVGMAKHLNNMPFGVLLWDEHLKLAYCSTEAATMFGCVADDILQKAINPLQYVHEDDAHTVADLISRIISGEVSHNDHLSRHITTGGNLIYCQWYNSALKSEDGKVHSILSLCQDVTAQVEARLSMEKILQQHSLAFNSAIDPMWLIRAQGNNAFQFETINAAFTKVTGWTPEQVEGQQIEQIMPAASHDLVRAKYNEAIETGTIVDYIEEASHPSGIKYGDIRVIPVWGEAGEPIRILGIAHDITERVYLEKKLDAEREIKSRQITSAAIRGQESERSKISRELHDNVNQILTTVKLYIELCVDQRVDTIEILPKCASLLNDTIKEIRNLSKRLSAPSLGNVNFKETLTDLAVSSQSSMQLEVSIKFNVLPFEEMDNELHLTLYRVAQEQLTNIGKYAKAKHVALSLTVDGSLLRFTIIDDGIGFDTHEKREGIGITNMQSRTEILNGTFKIDSAKGKGTRLMLEIPVLIEGNNCYAEQTVANVPTSST